MSKVIKLGKEGKQELIKGIRQLSEAVGCTLGPNGRNVVINNQNDIVKSTKDGVTVAKNIEFEDIIEETGAQMVKQAAIKTADAAGDGTTTSTVLASAMIEHGSLLLNTQSDLNPVQLKREIDEGVQLVIDEILINYSEDITDENQLEQIATISSNNDSEVGKLISTAIEKVGQDGIVHIEESKTGETYLETVEGMQLDRGYKSHFFVTNNSTMTCVLDNPYILIADQSFSQIKDLLPLLSKVSSDNKSLLIIANDIDNEALATLIVNKGRGTLNVAAIKSPDYGDRRKLILEDIATLTGGKVFDPERGMKFKEFKWEWFGEARKVTITKETTTIIDGKGNEDDIQTRLEELQSQITLSNTPFEIEKLQERLAKMVGGVSIIHVGGNTETEMFEKKDRVDDALNATKAALEEGIIPGGGIALLRARKVLLDQANNGKEIVFQACSEPFYTILGNAGFKEKESKAIYTDLLKQDDTWKGWNLKTSEYVNMKDEGIIDPMKVCREALENAASVAGTILLTECVIAEERNENEAAAMPPMGMY